MMDYQHSLLSYHLPSQLMPRKKNCSGSSVLQLEEAAGTHSQRSDFRGFDPHQIWWPCSMVQGGPGGTWARGASGRLKGMEIP